MQSLSVDEILLFQVGGRFSQPEHAVAGELCLEHHHHDLIDLNIYAGQILAIVGQSVAPPLFDTMVVLGQERVVRRLRAAGSS